MFKFNEKNSAKNPESNLPNNVSIMTQTSQPKADVAVDNLPEISHEKISSTEFSGVYADQQEETQEEQMMSAAKIIIEEKASDLIKELLESLTLNLESLSTTGQRCALRRNLLAQHRNFSYLPNNFKEFFLFTKQNALIDCEKTRELLLGTMKRFLKHIDLIDALIEMNYMRILVGRSQIVTNTDKEAFKNSLKNLLEKKELSEANCKELIRWFTTAYLDLMFLKGLNKVLIRKCQEKSLNIVRRMNSELSQIAHLESYSSCDDDQMIVWVQFWKKNKRINIQEAVTRLLDVTKKEQSINEKLHVLNSEHNAFRKVRIP